MDHIYCLHLTGTYYNIVKNFGHVRIDAIETYYQDLKIATQPTDNMKKIKFHSLYIFLLNSSEESAQDFLAKKIDNHH